MKKFLLILFILLFIPAQTLANDDTNCQPPYQPTNMLKVIFFYNKTLSYIASAVDTCNTNFAEQVKQVVNSSILLTKGCKEASIKDIEDALKKALTLGKSQAS
ncbi:MAG: hypothetical protein ACE5EK_02710 [Nitrospinales bacterium]